MTEKETEAFIRSGFNGDQSCLFESELMETLAEPKNFILIPGVPTLRKSIVPPVSMTLPITAYTNGLKSTFVGFVFLILALAMITVASTFFVVDPAERRLAEKVAMALVQLFGLGTFPFFLAGAVLAFRDAARYKPALVIDRKGIIDNRSGLSVSWDDVGSARPIITRADFWGATLNIRDPALLPRFSRLGHPLLFQWRRFGEVHIQCNLLSVPPHDIVYSILTLASVGGAQLLPPRLAMGSALPPILMQPR